MYPDYVLYFITGALLIWNVITFLLMGFDKYQARKGAYRVREKTLFLCAFFLGGVGIAVGMRFFHHKTRHKSFQILIPLGILFNCVSIGLVIKTVLV